MAWMVSAVLILFYVVGRFAFPETSLLSSLPYISVGVIIFDYLLAWWLRKIDSGRPDSPAEITQRKS